MEWFETDPGPFFHVDDLGGQESLTDPTFFHVDDFGGQESFVPSPTVSQMARDFSPFDLSPQPPPALTEFPPDRQPLWDPQTREIVTPQGQTLLDAAAVERAQQQHAELERLIYSPEVAGLSGTQRQQQVDGILASMERTLGPLSNFLGTRVGQTLAMLGLSTAALFINKAVQGSPKPFTPPAPTAGRAINNPVLTAQERAIREAAMGGIRNVLTPGGGGTSTDPITTSLTEQLQKALRGEISNPTLEKAKTTEDEAFLNRMARTYGPYWEGTPGARQQKQELSDSQAIRTYLDNMSTIGMLAPQQASRINQETNRNIQLSGITGMDAQRQVADNLNLQLAYQAHQADQARRAQTANSIAGILSGVGYAVSGRQRLPWETPTPAPAGAYSLYP